MGEVKYSINGKYFKDYGIYVSSSLGLLDALKRKPIKTYNWQEYHGESLDLSNPKFEAREIVLNCFIKGNNYQEMFDNFRNVVLSEFQKSGTQRLLVEPFGYKALPYEVYMIDEVKIAKEFSESTSIGVFSIKLIEPNPIKIVLYTTSDTLNLSYNSSKETEIFFINGEKITAKGNVSLSGKTLANRVVSGYDFSGRNLAKQSNKFNAGVSAFNITPSITSEGYLQIISVVGNENWHSGWVKNTTSIEEQFNEGDTFTITFWVKRISGTGIPMVFIKNEMGYFQLSGDLNSTDFMPISYTGIWKKGSNIDLYLGWGTTVGTFQISKWKIEKGAVSTPYSVAPEDEKYIIIAGNVDEITDITTNAEVLWEKL